MPGSPPYPKGIHEGYGPHHEKTPAQGAAAERALSARIESGHEETPQHQAARVAAEDDQGLRPRGGQTGADELEEQQRRPAGDHGPPLRLPGVEAPPTHPNSEGDCDDGDAPAGDRGEPRARGGAKPAAPGGHRMTGV